MTETLSLIPNLNEMMEEYVGNELQVTQEPLTIVTREEGVEARTEAETKTEQLSKENRKRKLSEEETE